MAKKNYLMPSTEQLNQVKQQLQAPSDKTPQIKVAEHIFRRFKGALYLTEEYADLSHWEKNVSLLNESLSNENIASYKSACKQVLTLPDKRGDLIFDIHISGEASDVSSDIGQQPNIALPEQGQRVSVRFSHDNPNCLPHYRKHSRAVKKVLQELNIAPWERKRIAFLYYDNELVAAVGHFVCQPYLADDTALGSMKVNIERSNT